MNKNDYECCDGLMDLDSMDLSDACNINRSCIDTLPLAMAYVPMQKWKNVYANDVALNRGTLFPELDLPFTGRGGMKHE